MKERDYRSYIEGMFQIRSEKNIPRSPGEIWRESEIGLSMATSR